MTSNAVDVRIQRLKETLNIIEAMLNAQRQMDVAHAMRKKLPLRSAEPLSVVDVSGVGDLQAHRF